MRAGGVKVTLRLLLLPAVLLFLAAPHSVALELPPLTGRVNDYADMISSRAESRLEELLKGLEETDSTQAVILTILSLEGEVLEEFSIKVAQAWGIGQKGKDNGVLLLVSKNDRSVRLEVGYGLEGRLTDLLAGRIIDNVILPEFKAGRFDEGFIAGTEAVVAAVRGEYTVPAAQEVRKTGTPGAVSWIPFIIIYMLVSLLGARSRFLGGLAGAFVLPLIAWIAFTASFPFLLALSPFGFLLGLIFSGRRRGPGGGWSRGSGGGGWSSGCGGGGFSGGGGSFGGGGASGKW